MNVLVITHVEHEGPGTLGAFLEARGANLVTARLHNGDGLPADFGEFNAVISMGGPMNVYEDDKYPYLKNEAIFLKEVIREQIPVLGICLGAQMIARACGAKVTKSPVKEVGWGEVTLTDQGKSDVLFQGLPTTLEVFQLHGDMFHVPDSGILTAEGEDCPHQAFTVGNAFGLQFHVEVTREMLSQWFDDSQELTGILKRYNELAPELNRHALRIYWNFLGVLRC